MCTLRPELSDTVMGRHTLSQAQRTMCRHTDTPAVQLAQAHSSTCRDTHTQTHTYTHTHTGGVPPHCPPAVCTGIQMQENKPGSPRRLRACLSRCCLFQSAASTARHPPAISSAAGRQAGTVAIKLLGTIYSSDNPLTDDMALKLSRGGADSFWPGVGYQDQVVSTQAGLVPPTGPRLFGALPDSTVGQRAATTQAAMCAHTQIALKTHRDIPPSLTDSHR